MCSHPPDTSGRIDRILGWWPSFMKIYRAPKQAEMQGVLLYSGQVIIVLAAVMLLPSLLGLLLNERSVAVDFFLSAAITSFSGLILMLIGQNGERNLNWTQGMVVAAFSWLLCTLLGAIPYVLSGYWLSYLDAVFDVMSGYTTTGLSLVQDIDHLPDAINTYRMLLSWLGGQGMVVLALTFFVRSMPGVFTLYASEGKDERLAPNVVNTTRAIWYISVVYLVVGTALLWLVGVNQGLTLGRGFLHALWVFMAAWSTGGFAPQSQNILYYHSFIFEITTALFFILGSMNFNLHWAVWTGNRREIYRNLEAVTFTVASTVLATIVIWGLANDGTYSGAAALFRKGYYMLMSAYTTTGFGTNYARQFVLDWGALPFVAIIIAMLFGGSASSTAGGFKAIRVGLVFKAIMHDVRRLLLPERAVVVQRFHMFRSATLDDGMARAVMTIIIMYTALWAFTTLVATMFGYDLASAAFEAASVTGNVGLSAGLTSAGMPWGLKIVYILAMWLGRLEFMAIWVFIGYVCTILRRR